MVESIFEWNVMYDCTLMKFHQLTLPPVDTVIVGCDRGRS